MARDAVVDAKTGEEFSLLRSGAFSDHLNSVVSLQLLQRAIGGPQQLAARVQINEIRGQLERRLAQESLTEPQRAVVQHMIDQLQRGNWKKTCIERREILRQQVLLLIAAQIHEVGANLQQTLPLAHTSVLRPTKDTWDHCGIAHVERRMIEDMEQIFSELNGERIFLDKGIEAPYVDAVGHIHVLRPEGTNLETVALAAHYTNISPGFSLPPEAVEDQQKRTKTVIRALRDEISSQKRSPRPGDKALRAERLLDSLENRLKQSTTFDAAADLIEAEKLLGWAVSTGCYSDKDRGGVAGRSVLSRLLAHSMEARGEKTKALLEENLYAAFMPGSCQMQFVRYVVSGRQLVLKAWPGGAGVLKIAKAGLSAIRSAPWSQSRREVSQ